jgi:hypothetical protein
VCGTLTQNGSRAVKIRELSALILDRLEMHCRVLVHFFARKNRRFRMRVVSLFYNLLKKVKLYLCSDRRQKHMVLPPACEVPYFWMDSVNLRCIRLQIGYNGRVSNPIAILRAM